MTMIPLEGLPSGLHLFAMCIRYHWLELVQKIKNCEADFPDCELLAMVR